METIITKAIVLRAGDYKDFDKLLRLLTPEHGVMTAAIKGVKRPKAKLKYAAQPFSVNEYVLAVRNGYATVTECAPIESLFEITYDPAAYSAGAVMLEATEYAVDEIASPYMFVYLLKALGLIAYRDKPPYDVCARYLTELLGKMGYGGEYGGRLQMLSERPIEELDERTVTAAQLKQLIARCETYFYREIKSKAVL